MFQTYQPGNMCTRAYYVMNMDKKPHNRGTQALLATKGAANKLCQFVGIE